MEDERLADAAPAADGTQVMDQQQQQQHEGDTGRRVDGVDQEHHHGAADDPQNTRVPGEVPERRPAERQREAFGCFLGNSDALVIRTAAVLGSMSISE